MNGCGVVWRDDRKRTASISKRAPASDLRTHCAHCTTHHESATTASGRGRATNHTSTATDKTTECRSNRIPNNSRPESKKHIDRHSTQHTPNTHTHTMPRRGRPGGAGEHWAFAGSRIKRSRGARARHSREQRGEVRHGGLGKDVATCWQQCCSQKMLWACCAEDYQPQPPLCKTCS
jgi:hypothetical protein